MTTTYIICMTDCVSNASRSMLVEVVLHPTSTSVEAIDAACPQVQKKGYMCFHCISCYRLLTTSREALCVMFSSNEKRIKQRALLNLCPKYHIQYIIGIKIYCVPDKVALTCFSVTFNIHN